MEKIEPNHIYNADCFEVMSKMQDNICDIILTSPPYNTARTGTNKRSFENYENRYDIHLDNKTDEEYLQWSVDLFNAFDRVLKPNGCVLYNISYSSENTDLIWKFVAEIIYKTAFTTADAIIWKKATALPNNTSSNKLTRICEFVFVFARKNELDTFFMNKSVESVSSVGQNYYQNISNYIVGNKDNNENLIEAPNNDASSDLNKATFSTSLCRRLLKLYTSSGDLVLDVFNGTGTTSVACVLDGRNYIGIELSKAQCEYAEQRIKSMHPDLFAPPIEKKIQPPSKQVSLGDMAADGDWLNSNAAK